MPTKHSPSASISAGREAVFANVGLNYCGKVMPQLGLKHTHTHTHTHTHNYYQVMFWKEAGQTQGTHRKQSTASPIF